MDIYIAVFVFLLLVTLAPNKWTWLFILIFVFLALFAGFRSVEVGVDTYQYYNIFRWINGDNYLGFIEPGWNYLNRYIYSAGGNFLILLTSVSVLTLCPVFFVTKKASPYIFLSIFVFYALHLYCGAFNLMRQYLAVSIVLLAYYYLAQNRIKIAIIILFIAISFHYSCFMAIITYFWQKQNLTLSRVLQYTIFAFIIGSVINESVVDFLTFSEYNNVSAVREETLILAIFTIFMDIFMFYLISIEKKCVLKEFWGKLFVLSIIVFNATYSLQYNARIYSLFAISQIIFFPLLLKNSHHHKNNIPTVLVLLYVSAQFWRMLLANANDIVPYEFNYQDLKLTIFGSF